MRKAILRRRHFKGEVTIVQPQTTSTTTTTLGGESSSSFPENISSSSDDYNNNGQIRSSSSSSSCSSDPNVRMQRLKLSSRSMQQGNVCLAANHPTGDERGQSATYSGAKQQQQQSTNQSDNDDPPTLIDDKERGDGGQQFTPPSPPPPRKSNNNNDDDEDYLERQRRLEERVEELELKLSVLSRMLPKPRPRNHAVGRSPSPPTAASTTPPCVHYHQPPPQQQQRQQSPLVYDHDRTFTTAPHLESPATAFSRKLLNYKVPAPEGDDDDDPAAGTERPHHRYTPNERNDDDTARRFTTKSPSHHGKNHNLSLMLLFEGDQEAYDRQCSAPLSSMTPAERQWLAPQMLHYQHQRHQQQQQQPPPPHQGSVAMDAADLSEQPRSAVQEVAAEEAQLSQSQQQTPPPKQPQPTASHSDRTTERITNNNTNNHDDDDLLCGRHPHISNHINNNNKVGLTNNDDDETNNVNLMKTKVRTKWLDYLNSVQEATPDVDVQMEEFIKVPAAVESIMGFGFFICVDSFLYMCTILPIRFVWSCLLLCIKLLYIMGRQHQPHHSHFQFHRRHLYQFIQVLILVVIYRYVLVPISIGKLYHWIRGQSMIKLYVIIAMVEIFDRLFSSLGQDCLDSMYWNTVSRPRSSRFVVSVIVVLVYAACHTLILFVHVATLNVAMNSADQALLTLLISGNFAEIKSTVFKKYNKAALFKITASDICERFKLALFLSLVLLLNICQGMDQKQFLGYLRICGLVWCAELVADWIKHAFITKFNFLPARVYPEYALLLAGDVTGIGHEEGMCLDLSHAVVKRIGFAQIPLLCVMFRLLKEAAKYYTRNHHPSLPKTSVYWRFWLTPLATSSSPRRIVVCVCVWVLLVLWKLGLGRLLQQISLRKLYAAPEYSQLTPLFTTKPKKKTQ